MINNDNSICGMKSAASMASELAISKILDFRSATSTRIAMIGGFSPRRCGIATFTTDVQASILAAFPAASVDIYAMQSPICAPAIAADICGVINQEDVSSYISAAQKIEESRADIVWLQHEFGLFGGYAGSHILRLVESVAAPLVVTLHTVLESPDTEQRAVMDQLVSKASRIVVMSETGRDVLLRVYRADEDQVVVIEHGVPDRPFGRSAEFKQKFGLTGKRALMTFGLLGPGKGIESVIAALPDIVARHPDTLYCIVGATHPGLIAREGERYREQLIAQAAKLGISDNIRWFNSFFELEELLDLIEAAEIYVTPYLGAEQSTSGTLSYAVALGKAVISTPYIHATELLADDHGILVPFNDSAAMATAVITLLDDPERLLAMQKRAYRRGRAMIWPLYAAQSMAVVQAVKVTPSIRSSIPRNRPPAAISFNGVSRISDDTGMLQHSRFAIPDRSHGYCIDDNARALMLMNRIGSHDADKADHLAIIYAAFIQHAWNPETRRFRNFMGFARQWLEDEGSEDSNGRTLWALGATAAEGHNASIRRWARILFSDSCLIALEFSSPRALAFAALGALKMLGADPDNLQARQIVIRTIDVLKAQLVTVDESDWLWFESVLAYDNCRLPEALLRCGMYLEDVEAIKRAMATLEWITAQQTTASGLFRPVGSETFGRELTSALPFDQQPVETWAAIDAADAAYDATGDLRWVDEANRAYQWFFGANDRGIAIGNAQSGTCRDGINARGVNENEGAESTLALHLADCTLRALLAKARRAEIRVSDMEPVNDVLV